MRGSAAVLDHSARRSTVLVVGPLPPPVHGCAVATRYVLAAGLEDNWNVVHLDTADRRGLENMGRFDARNIGLAMTHCAAFLVLLGRHAPRVVYVPLSQNLAGVLRDLLFLLPAVLTGRRVVVHVHGGGFGAFLAGSPRPLRWLVRMVLRRARQVIVLGDALRPSVDGIVSADRISAIPNGMPDPFPAGPPVRGGAGLRVLYLGNLIRSKGFLDVLAAVALLVERDIDVRVDLAGGWARAAERREAQALLSRLGDRVRLHGVVNDEAKRRLLAGVDVLAFPTYYEFEGHPYVVLEAMAAGLPVVTTAHAAIPDTVCDGETGLLVPARDPAALAAALERLAADPALRQRLGAAGRRRFLDRYTIGHWSQRLRTVIDGAAA